MSTVEKLRADIDAGRTGDKVSGSDPAAAPLGTDEEAAGTPISAAAVRMARRDEVSSSPKTNEDGGTLFYVAALIAITVVMAGSAFFLIHLI